MSFTEFLAAELGVALVDTGDGTIHGLVEHAGNRDAIDGVDQATLAEVLARGAHHADDDIAFGCISALVTARADRDEPYLEDFDDQLARLGRHVALDNAAAWIDRLVRLVARDDFAAGALVTIAQIAAIYAQPAWPATARRALCVAVLPIAVALDGAQVVEAAEALASIAQHHRDDAADLEVAVPRLCELVEGLHAEAAEAAAHALRAIGDRRAIDVFVRVLPTTPCVSAISYALVALEGTAAVPALTARVLKATDQRDRMPLLMAIAKLDPIGAAPQIAAAFRDDVDTWVLEIAEAGARAGDRTSQQLVAHVAATNPDPGLRARALATAARFDDSAGMLEHLARAVDDANESVRTAAVRGLRILRDPRAFDPLVRALRRGTPAAATALAELGEPRAVRPLVDALAITSATVAREVELKEAVLEAIGDLELDTDGAYEAAGDQLRHGSEVVAECAAVTLQQLRPASELGHAKLVAKLKAIGASERLRRRDLPDLARRLTALTNRPPRVARIAGVLLAALEELHATTSDPLLPDVIAAWRRWIEN